MSRRPGKPGGGDYEVGYCRPPVASRFQPGQSGNPKGRPRAKKSVGDHLRQALMTRVEVVENGRSRTMSAQEVILRNLVNEAARRNLKAIVTLFALAQRCETSDHVILDPSTLPPDDRDIVQAIFDQVKAATEQQASLSAQNGVDASEDGGSGRPASRVGRMTTEDPHE